ncbi:unnamed protein product [Haemonchus placei]|uniref:Uncharacterized protein n=1 Tax=Haemonchus placei TaxID=6290 RepID=A0A0N4VZW6_HAEPC|nr:unnamed protein product [Haemonchus placei]
MGEDESLKTSHTVLKASVPQNTPGKNGIPKCGTVESATSLFIGPAEMEMGSTHQCDVSDESAMEFCVQHHVLVVDNILDRTTRAELPQ